MDVGKERESDILDTENWTVQKIPILSNIHVSLAWIILEKNTKNYIRWRSYVIHD